MNRLGLICVIYLFDFQFVILVFLQGYHISIFFIASNFFSASYLSSIISPFPVHSHLMLSIGNASEIRAMLSLPMFPLVFPPLSEQLM
nr:MAG TPA: hypothetical protein [Caudoviricetes sp.]